MQCGAKESLPHQTPDRLMTELIIVPKEHFFSTSTISQAAITLRRSSQKHTLHMTILSTFLFNADKNEEMNWPALSLCFHWRLINTCQTFEAGCCFSFLANYRAVWLDGCLHRHTPTLFILFFSPPNPFPVASGFPCTPSRQRKVTPRATVHTPINTFAALQSFLMWASSNFIRSL